MGAVRTVRDAVAVARDRNLTFLAAGVVFYAFTSVPPLLLLALAVGSALVGPESADAVVAQVGGLLSESGQRVVAELVAAQQGRIGAGIVGFLVLAWSALKLFRGLAMAFGEVYDVEGPVSPGEQLRDAVVLALATGVVLALVAVTGAVIAVPSLVAFPYAGAVGAAVLVVGLAVGVLPVYYVLPPVEMTVRKALPGVVVAAVGWSVLQVLFHAYAGRASRYAAYGILGAVLLFVTWLYFAGVVLLFGAVVNAVLGGDVAPRRPEGTPAGRERTGTGDASGQQ